MCTDSLCGQILSIFQPYYFARDDRVYKAFTDRLDQHKDAIRRLSKRLRWQIEVLREVMEGRSLSFSVS